MSKSEMTDEYQTASASDEKQITPEQAALNQRAMSDAYVGQSLLNPRDLSQEDLNNLIQRLQNQRAISMVEAELRDISLVMNQYGYTSGDFSADETFSGLSAGYSSSGYSASESGYSTGQLFAKNKKAHQNFLRAIAEQMQLRDDVFLTKQVEGLRITQTLRDEAQTLIMPTTKVSKKEKIQKAQDNATQYTRRSTRGISKLTPTKQRNMEREQRRLRRARIMDEPEQESKGDVSNGVTLNDERLNVVVTRIRPSQIPRTTVITQLPPGIGYNPFGTQGTPNYVPGEEYDRFSSDNSRNDFPSDRRVYEDERKHEPVQQKINGEDAIEKFREMKFRLGELGAQGDQLIDMFGGIDGYFSTIADLIMSGEEPENIIQNSLSDLYGGMSGNMLNDINQRDGRSLETLDRDAVINTMGNVDPALQEEILGLMEKAISSEPNNRTENKMDIPDQGGLPVSSSTGTNTSGLYEDYGEGAHDPENDGYRYSRYHGDGSGGDGGGGGGGPGSISSFGGGAFQAMQQLHNLAPHLAQLISNDITRPLYIKRMKLPSIYPPPPKNTNLAIVQQAIAKYEEEASLLNVYFG